jgi:hypothetical protein
MHKQRVLISAMTTLPTHAKTTPVSVCMLELSCTHPNKRRTKGNGLSLILGRHEHKRKAAVAPLLRAAVLSASGNEQLTAGDRRGQTISRTRGAAANHEEPGRRRREAADEGAERVVALVPVVRRAALLHVPRVPVLRRPVAERPASAAPAAFLLLRPIVVRRRRRRRRRHRRRVEDRWGMGPRSWRSGSELQGGGKVLDRGRRRWAEHRHRCGARAGLGTSRHHTSPSSPAQLLTLFIFLWELRTFFPHFGWYCDSVAQFSFLFLSPLPLFKKEFSFFHFSSDSYDLFFSQSI